MLEQTKHEPTGAVLPHGVALLRDPMLNKGTAFSEKERDTLGLRGLLPAHVLSMEMQAQRVITNLRQLPNDRLSKTDDVKRRRILSNLTSGKRAGVDRYRSRLRGRTSAIPRCGLAYV